MWTGKHAVCEKKPEEPKDTWLKRWGASSAAYGKETNSLIFVVIQATVPTENQGWEGGRKSDNLCWKNQWE